MSDETPEPPRSLQVPPEDQARIRWHPSEIEREDRWMTLGQRGATVWLTGLPASGKSTIAAAVERHLVLNGRASYVLDGDNVRHGLSQDLGFGQAARSEQARRVAHVARLMADAGTVVLVAIVSPLRADRAVARAMHAVAGLDFIEVFVDTPLAECERRDPKGLYRDARRGVVTEMTGVDAPYEAPEEPELHLVPQEAGVEAGMGAILDALDALELRRRASRPPDRPRSRRFGDAHRVP